VRACHAVSGWPYTVSYARSGGSRAAGKVALREDQPSHRAICAIAAWEAGGALRAITNGALATKRISLRSTGQRRLLLESSSNARMGRLRSQGFVSGGEENRLPNPKRPPARLVPSLRTPALARSQVIFTMPNAYRPDQEATKQRCRDNARRLAGKLRIRHRDVGANGKI
jgi:hypothetical protein